MSHPFRSKKEIILAYQQNIHHHSQLIKKLKKEKNLIAFARLATVLAGFAVSWYLWPLTIAFSASVIIFSVILIFLIFRDADKSAEIKNRERLIRINEHEIDALTLNLNSSGYDNGHSFADPVHAYASDLDLFGPSSLFQYLSRCHADQSRKLLADYLKTPLSPFRIKEKQEAAKELSEKQSVCQHFQSMAMANPLTFTTEDRIKHWMDLPPGSFEKPYWKWIRNLYPLITISLLALFILDLYPIRPVFILLDLIDRVFIPDQHKNKPGI